MMHQHLSLISIVLFALLAGSVDSFSTNSPADTTCDRRQAFSAVASSIVGAATVASLPIAPALAKGEVDPSRKGTKSDPSYEACVSQCLYDCTKPKGEEQKSRAECIPECKKKCATTKEQLMVGTPVKND
eukprot:CAMPEP_0178477672 /NCGR_PEP_ID=MMETSP0696-20121128/4252_1 /TAXON_ID=265572 /ORGANISM="Extubocellulus spinifer, Strain CCMP396" /LENGTH=129 /DNA_ID=CAMNT_0020104991 /DNA_START=37 /DNA_END=426 /DNA_ORIENTATION=-